MLSPPEPFDYLDGITGGTGSQSEQKTITLSFDKYEVTIMLDEEGRPVAIQRITVKKSFIDSLRKETPKGFHDVEEFYRDEE